MTSWDIGHYMKFITADVEMQGGQRIYHVGDNFQISVVTVNHDPKCRYDLMHRWKSAGFVSKFMPTTLHISTYYTDAKGNCWGRYNIMEKNREDAPGRVVNFDYLREATPENEKELVAECIKLWDQAENAEAEPLVGRVRFASGEQTEYTDVEEYIKAVKEELPYRSTTGFEFQTLTKDPAVRKAVDDEIYNLYGEENPRRLEDYQEQGQEQEPEPELEEEEPVL